MTTAPETIRVVIPLTIKRRNGRPRILPPADIEAAAEGAMADPRLLRAIARGLGLAAPAGARRGRDAEGHRPIRGRHGAVHQPLPAARLSIARGPGTPADPAAALRAVAGQAGGDRPGAVARSAARSLRRMTPPNVPVRSPSPTEWMSDLHPPRLASGPAETALLSRFVVSPRSPEWRKIRPFDTRSVNSGSAPKAVHRHYSYMGAQQQIGGPSRQRHGFNMERRNACRSRCLSKRLWGEQIQGLFQ